MSFTAAPTPGRPTTRSPCTATPPPGTPGARRRRPRPARPQQQLDRRHVADDQHRPPGVLGQDPPARPRHPRADVRDRLPARRGHGDVACRNRRAASGCLAAASSKVRPSRSPKSSSTRSSSNSTGSPSAAATISAVSRVRRSGDATTTSTPSSPTRSAAASASARPVQRQRQLVTAAEPTFGGVLGLPVPQQVGDRRDDRRGLGARLDDRAPLGNRTTCGGLDLVLQDDGLGGRVAVDRPAVHRAVGQRVGGAVLRPRHPGVADRPELPGDLLRLQGELAHVGVLDLPAARHLLDDELGVHPHLDLGGRVEVERRLQAGDQAAVLGDVVGRAADRRGPLGQQPPGLGVPHQRAVAGRARVAPRPAVRLDDERGRAPQQASGLGGARPGSGRSSRSARTSCGSALRTAASSLP